MRVLSWNVRKANKDSKVWDLIIEENPDIALLQEVGGLPNKIISSFEALSKPAIYKTGKFQKFNTVVLVKGKIVQEIILKSGISWVDKELDFFDGNFVSCKIELENQKKFNVVSVYSPAWPVDDKKMKGVAASEVKLLGNSKVWATEIFWSALSNMVFKNDNWIVGGDYNSSETFDKEYQKKHGLKGVLSSSGNKEIRERMYELGFNECLLEYNGKLTPTFKHSKGKVIH